LFHVIDGALVFHSNKTTKWPALDKFVNDRSGLVAETHGGLASGLGADFLQNGRSTKRYH
jgi:hypothetical protein